MRNLQGQWRGMGFQNLPTINISHRMCFWMKGQSLVATCFHSLQFAFIAIMILSKSLHFMTPKKGVTPLPFVHLRILTHKQMCCVPQNNPENFSSKCIFHDSFWSKTIIDIHVSWGWCISPMSCLEAQ